MTFSLPSAATSVPLQCGLGQVGAPSPVPLQCGLGQVGTPFPLWLYSLRLSLHSSGWFQTQSSCLSLPGDATHTPLNTLFYGFLVKILTFRHIQELSPVAPARAANGSAESLCLDPRDSQCT